MWLIFFEMGKLSYIVGRGLCVVVRCYRILSVYFRWGGFNVVEGGFSLSFCYWGIRIFLLRFLVNIRLRFVC